MIELIGLNKSFLTTNALADVSLFVQEGEIFGIIGKSGAGKSTLLRCINRLETPDTGQILVDNQDITDLTPQALRQARHKMAMIFQHFNLLESKTVSENIALPMIIQGVASEQIKEKIAELLPLVELEEKEKAYPSQLSGGQKQRVAIARALSTSPKILLCDEATSALDPETTESILNLLKKINQLYGITIVLITHEMDVIKRICHRLAVMESGKIVELTPLASVFNNPQSLARNLLYAQLSPQLPPCFATKLSPTRPGRPLLKIFFQGQAATVPFISQASRDLNININILLANIDRFDTITCGVVIVEIDANDALVTTFKERCEQQELTVEFLGYVNDPLL